MSLRKPPCGFTIIEIVGVIAVLSVVAGVTFLILGGVVKGHFDFMSTDDLLGRGRAGFEKIIEDLRAIRSPEDILAYSPSEIRFLNYEGSEIHLVSNAGQILRNGQIVLENLTPLTGFVITYYDASGHPVNSPQPENLIRFLGVSVVLETRGKKLPLYTQVFPGNFHPGVGSWAVN